ncbi:2512_t:CDS:1 [Paraglomus occultum]|uniref:2512_t:CDS:1 n=1 Tax=Paraglomus occultum TaxID=144539 RepID=A0A9N9GTZ9_9GLOM|nr:2512_t:CDS:1 [Paraglomus occultum]
MGEVNEANLVQLSNCISDASAQLQIASLCLRSLYVTNNSSVPEFVQLRNSIVNDANVYRIQIFPFANAVVTYLQEFCENYTTFTFDEFCENIADLANEANERVSLSRFTAELHKRILVDFKKKQDQATIVLQKLDLETKALNEKEQRLRNKVETDYAWALRLLFVPVVGAKAREILSKKRDSVIQEANAAASERDIAAAASSVIKGPLLEAINSFIDRITKIAEFFQVLTNELVMLANNQQENPRKMHYIRVRAKAEIIIDACRLYMSRIPDSETNLRAIPDNYDKNYVQQWLSTEHVEVNGTPTSFLTWGQLLFGKNNKLKHLFTAEV